ncbi:MAG: hypothetical protein U0992_00735 [Planctomycetaceae bacterium]
MKLLKKTVRFAGRGAGEGHRCFDSSRQCGKRTLYELPRPVTVVRWQDSWDFACRCRWRRDLITGRLANGVDIALEGEIGTRGGALAGDEAGMFAAVQALRAALVGVDAGPGLPVFCITTQRARRIGRSSGARPCGSSATCRRPQLFSYSAAIHAADPAIYTSAPGDGRETARNAGFRGMRRLVAFNVPTADS